MSSPPIIEQQEKCLDLLKEFKKGIDQQVNNFLNNNNNYDNDKQNLFELLFKLRDTQGNLELMVDDVYLKPIREIKDNVSKYDIQIEDILYEKSMLESEINDLQNLNFDLNDPKLGISSLSNFLKDKTPQQIEQFNSKPIEIQNVERLEWEIYQRKLKSNKLEKLEKLKIKLNQENQRVLGDLEFFENKLKSGLDIKKSIEPFQKFITELPTKNPIDHRNTPILVDAPQPIYILYHELAYFKEFFLYDSFDIELLIMDKEKQDSINSNLVHRSLILPSKIYISLDIKKNSNNFKIEFYYYPNLKIVTVLPLLNDSFENGQKLLENLDKTDTGLITPNLSNNFISKNYGKDSFNLDDLKLYGRPYKWAQFITGLSFLPEITQENMKDKNFHIHDFKPKTSHKILFDIINSL
ncbi:hypothetical protein DICPUDRAFT_147137 [Dictyostelium purpureum]|uniref:Uncharacterized protein n=1 Tax=Dictyostelium purpureum TaxID=5786 RepID=F0Z7R5_DICPU|nr:uncharacterized protein DICPUDRAFT_147137 [Dictyostelium purpureum]EGC39991.1 hypothetical protein DICPUDRAFT_147137 [Dictyostelium purpureum]|eukprot:XP_003283494.1 hypothetical protein DICPUDRAFT_147137 [Dictyostelium purpureum]